MTLTKHSIFPISFLNSLHCPSQGSILVIEEEQIQFNYGVRGHSPSINVPLENLLGIHYSILMPNWLQQGGTPMVSRANPGQHVELRVGFSNGTKSWEETANVMTCMSNVLVPAGYACTVHKSWIELSSGFIIQPRFVSFQPLEKGGARTVTTIEVTHPAGVPVGVFEFQHSTGDSVENSIIKGFEAWTQSDLPVFIDALRHKPEQCTYLQIAPSSASSTFPAKRRVVLGPVAHLVTGPSDNKEDAHPFCPCCLFTKTGPIWKEKISASAFYGVRLFAMRGPDGTPGADCRINGEDWDAGKAALVEYVNSWPDRGVEFRKQYIILQNQPNP
jgi:hypothetical protein